jgi:hypothetical protein
MEGTLGWLRFIGLIGLRALLRLETSRHTAQRELPVGALIG